MSLCLLIVLHTAPIRANVRQRIPALAGLGALFAALTAAASTEPARLGAAEPLPLLEEVREVEEEAGSNGSRQQQGG